MSARGLPARTLVAVAGLIALAVLGASLGRWQLRRADETTALARQFAAAGDAAPLEHAPDVVGDELRFRRLAVRGAYHTARQFLLDNRIREGVAGYEVLTAFRLADDHRWLLVNRGWVAANPDRSVLPNIAVDAAEREIGGRIERLPRPGMRLGASAAPADIRGGTVVVVYPTANELGALLGEPLLDYELLLDDSAPDGYARGWVAPGLGVERHLAYAGQWFLLALGALAAGLTIAVRTLKARAVERRS